MKATTKKEATFADYPVSDFDENIEARQARIAQYTAQRPILAAKLATLRTTPQGVFDAAGTKQVAIKEAEAERDKNEQLLGAEKADLNCYLAEERQKFFPLNGQLWAEIYEQNALPGIEGIESSVQLFKLAQPRAVVSDEAIKRFNSSIAKLGDAGVQYLIPPDNSCSSMLKNHPGVNAALEKVRRLAEKK